MLPAEQEVVQSCPLAEIWRMIGTTVYLAQADRTDFTLSHTDTPHSQRGAFRQRTTLFNTMQALNLSLAPFERRTEC